MYIIIYIINYLQICKNEKILTAHWWSLLENISLKTIILFKSRFTIVLQLSGCAHLELPINWYSKIYLKKIIVVETRIIVITDASFANVISDNFVATNVF